MLCNKSLRGYELMRDESRGLEMLNDARIDDVEDGVKLRLQTFGGPSRILTIFILGLASGFLLSQALGSPPTHSSKWLDDMIPTIETEFQYNELFGRPPTPVVETAWRSIFPPGRGFVQDFSVPSNISGLAVFHELHCLNAIRHALYENQAESKNISIEARGEHHAMYHVKHCFDYLRQSLMCHADTNPEPVDLKAGGVTGWGSKRVCRDYEQVVLMATRLRTHDQKDIS